MLVIEISQIFRRNLEVKTALSQGMKEGGPSRRSQQVCGLGLSCSRAKAFLAVRLRHESCDQALGGKSIMLHKILLPRQRLMLHYRTVVASGRFVTGRIPTHSWCLSLAIPQILSWAVFLDFLAYSKSLSMLSLACSLWFKRANWYTYLHSTNVKSSL